MQGDCIVNDDEPKQGTVIDISSSGMRFLCDGKFSVGQSFSIELKTDRSHGNFEGVIRRVEPWMGGQSILGCELVDTIPNEVLGELAHEGIVNRRRDERVDWNQPAKITWELHPGDVDIEIKDCSLDGLKITSQTPIPDNVRLRICVDMGDQDQVVVDAKTVWQLEQADQCVAGLAFTKREAPETVKRLLAKDDATEATEQKTNHRSSIRRSILVATVIVVFGLALL